MNDNYVLKYDVDIVFCMDATGSMSGILDKVKARALDFYKDLSGALLAKGKHVDRLRARIIAFRDYLADGREAMQMTDFFDLPEQSETFARCINSIYPKGGGDIPEDALEALAYAIRSDWSKSTSLKKRQIIVLWTDAGPHPLGFGKESPNYPKKMARDMTELSEWWGGVQGGGYMDARAKRLLLYAPEDPAWEIILENWANTIYFESIAGQGLQEFEYQQIIDTIVNSI